jgi:hypothetical protein
VRLYSREYVVRIPGMEACMLINANLPDGDLGYDLLTSTIVLLAGSQLVVLEPKKVSRCLIESWDGSLLFPDDRALTEARDTRAVCWRAELTAFTSTVAN